MIEEMDVRMMDQQAGKGVAEGHGGVAGGHGGVAGGQGRRTPVKAELRQKIQSRRRAQGQDDLSQVGLFQEPEKHELTAEEMERKERRRLQNRMAARRCREKKKKQQLYTREEFQQVSDERDHFKNIAAELYDLTQKHKIHVPFSVTIKQEAGVQSACAASNFMPLPVKTEPGLEGQSCRQQGAQPPQFCGPDTELRALLSPPLECLVSTSPILPEDIFTDDLCLPFRYGSDPLNAPGGSPEGALWGRDLPSTSDSDYAAATPQSCLPLSPAEGACVPSPNLPSTQGSMGFDLQAATTSPCLGSPEGLSMATSELSFYPATPDTPQDDICEDELAMISLAALKDFIEYDDEVFEDQESGTLSIIPSCIVCDGIIN